MSNQSISSSRCHAASERQRDLDRIIELSRQSAEWQRRVNERWGEGSAMYWHLWSLFAQAMNEVYGYPNSMRWYERELDAKARAADTTGELQSAIAEAVERARERKAINAKYNAARDMQWFQEVFQRKNQVKAQKMKADALAARESNNVMA